MARGRKGTYPPIQMKSRSWLLPQATFEEATQYWHRINQHRQAGTVVPKWHVVDRFIRDGINRFNPERWRWNPPGDVVLVSKSLYLPIATIAELMAYWHTVNQGRQTKDAVPQWHLMTRFLTQGMTRYAPRLWHWDPREDVA